MPPFSRLATTLFVLAQICSITAYPTPSNHRITTQRYSRTTTTSAPRFVVYGDRYNTNGAPTAADISGFNVFALPFFLSSGPADNALAWKLLTNAQRASIKAEYAAAGISLIVCAFGSTDLPTSKDPTATANSIATFVKQYALDGVDVDYEDLAAMETGTAEPWLISFTQALRAELPQGKYILTHSPVAPWFNGNQIGGGYIKIDQQVGSDIDWYNVQFYNQGATEYTTCNNLLNSAGGTLPDSSLFEIAKSVNMNKLVIGKPATAADATIGYVDPTTLATCISQAKSKGWNAGVAVWQYPDANHAWITAARGSAFPV